MTLKETVKEIFDDIDDLKGVVAAMKHPNGAKDNPGRTCHDIHLGHPRLSDGSFRVYILSFVLPRVRVHLFCTISGNLTHAKCTDKQN